MRFILICATLNFVYVSIQRHCPYGYSCMNSTSPLVAKRFTVADFHCLGQRNGFSYHLPGIDNDDAGSQSLCIAEGRVKAFVLRNGLNLVLSDIAVHEQYEATSMNAPQLCAIVMLQGQAYTAIRHHSQEYLTASSGVSALYSDMTPMTGYHSAGQRMQSVNLSLSAADTTDDERLGELFGRAMRHPGFGQHRWQVPPFLRLSIANLLHSPWDEPVHDLLGEGVGLQLLAHTLRVLGQENELETALSVRDAQRLERVREHIHDAPGEEHSLAHLARLACMSPSALRAKFLMAYQCSVFSYLRERRLEVAHARLKQGYSVQQVSHWVGYRHASNFATAFRQRYGIAPSALLH